MVHVKNLTSLKTTIRQILLSKLILLTSVAGFCETKPTGFLDGVKAYQVRDYKKARDIFASLFEESPDNPSLLFNLGLSEFHLQRPGLALGLWRKAVFIDKNFSQAREAINYVEDKLLPDREKSLFIRSLYIWLAGFSLHLWIFLSLSGAFTFVWFCLEYGIKLKKSPLSWPLWIYALIPLTVFTTSLSFFIHRDQNQIKATVIQKNKFTHASPSRESPSLSELREGQLVFVEKFHGHWIQIRTRGGSPGWVPESSLLLFGKSQRN